MPKTKITYRAYNAQEMTDSQSIYEETLHENILINE